MQKISNIVKTPIQKIKDKLTTSYLKKNIVFKKIIAYIAITTYSIAIIKTLWILATTHPQHSFIPWIRLLFLITLAIVYIYIYLDEDQFYKHEFKMLKKAINAKERVQDFLIKNLPKDYHIIPYIFGGFYIFDAIVVGPTGIFLIDIKPNAGIIFKDVDGTISILDPREPRLAFQEEMVNKTMYFKKHFFISKDIEDVIKPVLVFPFGTPLKGQILSVPGNDYTVAVMDEDGLLNYILNRNCVLNKETIEMLSNEIEEAKKNLSIWE